MFKRWAIVVAYCLWIIGGAGVAAAGPAPVSRMDWPLANLEQGIGKLYGTRCGPFGLAGNELFASCDLNYPAEVDIYLDAWSKKIEHVQIQAWVIKDREWHPKRFRSAKPACLRAFAALFPGWPGAERWLSHAFDAALASTVPMDLPPDSPGYVSPHMGYGPFQTITVEKLKVWVYKDETTTGPAETYIRIDITRGPSPFDL